MRWVGASAAGFVAAVFFLVRAPGGCGMAELEGLELGDDPGSNYISPSTTAPPPTPPGPAPADSPTGSPTNAPTGTNDGTPEKEINYLAPAGDPRVTSILRTNADRSSTPNEIITANKTTVTQCSSFKVSAVSTGGPSYAAGDTTAIQNQTRPQNVKGYASKDCGISDSSADAYGPNWTMPLVRGWNVLASNDDFRMSLLLDSVVYMKFEKYSAMLNRWDTLTEPVDPYVPGMMVAQKDACMEKCVQLIQLINKNIDFMNQTVLAREEAAKLLGCPNAYQRAVERNTTLDVSSGTSDDGGGATELDLADESLLI